MFRKQSPLPSGNKIRPPKSDAIAEFSNVIPACGNDSATVFIVHKRELSDSMIESVSSLFYLLHCSAHDRLNTMTFRSFRNIPHGLHPAHRNGKATENSLPQHIPHGLHQKEGATGLEVYLFASAHPARTASAKSHRCNATNPRNML